MARHIIDHGGNMKISKLLSSLVSIALFVSIAGCQNVDEKTAQADFDAFMEQEFIDTVESDYLTYKTLIDDPEQYDINVEEIEVNLGERLDPENYEDLMSESNESYEEFKSFDYDSLSEEQKDVYDAYAYMMEIDEALCDKKFWYYTPYFESMSGLHYQLPTLFADWQVDNEQEVQEMILLVEDVLDYVNGAIEYTKKQEEMGLLMIDIDEVLNYCQNIIDTAQDSAVLSAMKETIQSLGLSNEVDYIAQLEDAFYNSFIPAYENIIAMLNEFSQSAQNNEQGLASFENGKEYFEILIKQNTGLDKDPLEIKEMMEDAYQDHILSLQVYAYSNPDAVNTFIQGTMPETGFNSYEEILEFAKQNLVNDFPEVNDLEYEIKDVNEQIASDTGVAAYFQVPTLDGNEKKQLRVNPKGSDISSIDTYMTVCHEGFPGHMYQYGYMYENVSSNLIKGLAQFNAYTEGYAVYAQYEALDYLTDIDPNLLTLYAENEQASYCAVVAADIGIHYEGYTLEQFTDYMSQSGFALDEDSAKALYAQLQANPAVFEPYYVGNEVIQDLKESAQEKLSEDFTDKGFNQAILECGNMPFEVVQRHVDSYALGNVQA